MSFPLTYHELGNPGAPILFFIHGWPDSAALWTSQLSHFSSNYRCVAVTLPEFFDSDTGRGEDFPVLVDCLVTTIKKARGNSQDPVVIVGHDWGAYLTYLLDQKHPELASRLITMDVGAHFKPRSLGHALFMLSYQWWLVAAFCIGRVIPIIGDWMTRWFSHIAFTPRDRGVHHRMNYLYFYFWRARLFSRYRAALPIGYRPQKPILYLYGKAKRYHFHSAKWEEIVAKTAGSQVVGIEKAGHWFPAFRPKETNAAMEAWLKTVGV